MSEVFNVFVEGNFVGTAPDLVEANLVAKRVASRLGKIGQVAFFITDNKNNRRQGGSIYVA